MADVGVALGIAGIGVALPVLAETAVTYGKFVVSKYHIFKDGQEERDVQKLLVKLHWDEIQATILFFAKSCDRFDDTVRDLVEAHLHILLKKFEVVILNLQKNVRSESEIRRLRYAFFGKQILEDLIADLEKWQTRFLQYLQLITFTGHRLVEPHTPAADIAKRAPSLTAFTRLQDISVQDHRQSVAPDWLKESDYPEFQAKILRCCTVLILPDPGRSPSGPTMELIDRRYYDKDQDNIEYVRQISMAPRAQRPKSSSRASQPSRSPHGSHTRRSRVPLTERALTPGEKAGRSCLLYAHFKIGTQEHRPETILVLPASISNASPNSSATQPERQSKTAHFPYALGRPVLVGFDNVRQVELDWASKLRGTLSWEAGVYQHPSRHGATAARYYSVQHDMYSLGVVLIEIALWESFIAFDKDMKDFKPNVALWGKATSKVEGLRKGESGTGEGIMARLEKLAKLEVPVVMGDKHRQVILSCLSGIGEYREEINDVELGVRFIRTVLEDLEKISI